ncbi:hypothetical protein Mapa_000082 [Marchantia paleacea]|nr:hypothetical protein Mapa_000082 [Marchantia paleacea]
MDEPVDQWYDTNLYTFKCIFKSQSAIQADFHSYLLPLGTTKHKKRGEEQQNCGGDSTCLNI